MSFIHRGREEWKSFLIFILDNIPITSKTKYFNMVVPFLSNAFRFKRTDT